MKTDNNHPYTTQVRPITSAKPMRWLIRYPVFLTAILMSSINSIFFVLMCCDMVDREFYPKLVKPSLFPGIFPLYFLGTISNSPTIGWIGFGVGMFGTYGLVGISLDLLLQRLKQRK